MPENLMGPPATRLAEDGPDAPVLAELAAGTHPSKIAATHPASSAVWAALADVALADGETVYAYACARTGYHRGLDSLRRGGWRGAGPVPWNHEPNRGVLRAIGALAKCAAAIGETDEETRCLALLDDADPAAREALGL